MNFCANRPQWYDFMQDNWIIHVAGDQCKCSNEADEWEGKTFDTLYV